RPPRAPRAHPGAGAGLPRPPPGRAAPPPPWGPAEQAHSADVDAWTGEEGGYAHVHSTKPATLGAALHDSPAGLGAWIGEKITAWSSTRAGGQPTFPQALLLPTLTLYWVPGTITSSLMPYWAYRNAPASALPAGEPAPVPTAVTVFGGERVPFPKPPRELAERYFRVTAWAEHDRGGHFPAVAEPQLLAATLRDAFPPLREPPPAHPPPHAGPLLARKNGQPARGQPNEHKANSGKYSSEALLTCSHSRCVIVPGLGLGALTRRSARQLRAGTSRRRRTRMGGSAQRAARMTGCYGAQMVDQAYLQRAGTAQGRVAQLFSAVGSASFGGEVVQVPDRFEGADVAGGIARGPRARRTVPSPRSGGWCPRHGGTRSASAAAPHRGSRPGSRGCRWSRPR